jgi:hypothetical protein
MAVTIRVWADTEERSVCREGSCRKRLLWAEVVESGRRMCFEAAAVVLRVETDLLDRRIHVYDLADSHWGSCTNPDRFRKR